jgi:S-adenosylmethionine synthetase
MLYTAECVTPKHPDKICDQISDLVLDLCLIQDPYSRVAVETMGGHNQITLTGEISTKATITSHKIRKEILLKFPSLRGYNISINISKQSPNIAQGVDIGGAGDQGIMIGYATNENDEYVPNEYFLARKLARSLYDKYPYDGKTQVTLNGKGEIVAVVASFQNAKKQDLLIEVKKVIPTSGQYFVNPAGDWNIGGFDADTGVTGRKLAVDNYGPRIPIGGGAFSGKDGTKVDRSGAYIARKIAVDYLKKFGAKEVYTKLAYSIGVKEPVMAVAMVDGKEFKIKGYDLSPKGIIDFLDLKPPKYFETARFGHFGSGFVWG